MSDEKNTHGRVDDTLEVEEMPIINPAVIPTSPIGIEVGDSTLASLIDDDIDEDDAAVEPSKNNAVKSDKNAYDDVAGAPQKQSNENASANNVPSGVYDMTVAMTPDALPNATGKKTSNVADVQQPTKVAPAVSGGAPAIDKTVVAPKLDRTELMPKGGLADDGTGINSLIGMSASPIISAAEVAQMRASGKVSFGSASKRNALKSGSMFDGILSDNDITPVRVHAEEERKKAEEERKREEREQRRKQHEEESARRKEERRSRNKKMLEGISSAFGKAKSSVATSIADIATRTGDVTAATIDVISNSVAPKVEANPAENPKKMPEIDDKPNVEADDDINSHDDAKSPKIEGPDAASSDTLDDAAESDFREDAMRDTVEDKMNSVDDAQQDDVTSDAAPSRRSSEEILDDTGVRRAIDSETDAIMNEILGISPDDVAGDAEVDDDDDAVADADDADDAADDADDADNDDDAAVDTDDADVSHHIEHDVSDGGDNVDVDTSIDDGVVDSKLDDTEADEASDDKDDDEEKSQPDNAPGDESDDASSDKADGDDAEQHEEKLSRKEQQRLRKEHEAHEALLDAFYLPLMDNRNSCSIYFASKHYHRDFKQLDVKHGKRTISYRVQDDKAFYYADVDYSFTGDGRDFAFTQSGDGRMHVYGTVTKDGGEMYLLCETPPVDDAFDPANAFVWDERLYVVMNQPTDEMFMMPLKRRLPHYGVDTTRSSGSVSLWSCGVIPSKRNSLEPVFASDDVLSGYCTSIIPNTSNGAPGLLFVNNSDARHGFGRTPKTFSDLKRTVIGRDIGNHIPIGVSVYDVESDAFDRVSIDGNVRWGIGSVAIFNEKTRPKAMEDAEFDNSGVQKVLF